MRALLPRLRQNDYLHWLPPLLFVLSELVLELLCWFEVLLLFEDLF